jgi:hypothetical protein
MGTPVKFTDDEKNKLLQRWIIIFWYPSKRKGNLIGEES